MRPEEIEKTIKDILVRNNYGIKMPRDFPVGDSLFLHGIIDSFGIFPFVRELQARFDVKITNSEIHPGSLETIENVTFFIQGKTKRKEGK